MRQCWVSPGNHFHLSVYEGVDTAFNLDRNGKVEVAFRANLHKEAGCNYVNFDIHELGFWTENV